MDRNTSKWIVTLTLAMLVSMAGAQTVTGVVTNKTNDKPAAGDDVVLLKLAQGMQELLRTKTDSRGHYTLKIPAEEATSVHLVRVNHDGANYFSALQPGMTKVDVEVYSAAKELEGIKVSEDVLQIQTAPDGNTLRLVQHYLVQNTSQPAMTLFSEHPFELYLPTGAVVDGASAKSPGGMAVEQPTVPMGDANHYTIIFPIRPGETEFNVWYHVPYKGSFTFEPRLTLPTDALALMLPKSMNFKSGPGAVFNSVTEQVGGKAQAFLAQGVKPSEPLGFTVSGKGELPRDTVAQGSAGDSAATPTSTGKQPPPGGGLGPPGDSDGQQDPWTKYRWWIIGGLGLAMAIAAGFMMRTPGPVASAGIATTAGPANALEVLRNEMFAVETDRLEGHMSDTEYTELKQAFDIVLKRALARNARN